jgi:hypothetical protein
LTARLGKRAKAGCLLHRFHELALAGVLGVPVFD